MKTRSMALMLVASLAVMSLACKENASSKNANLDTPPAVKPTPAVMAMAQNPTPPPNAKQKTSAGAGKLSVNTANSAGDKDVYWVASIDIDGDGVVEETQCLYDEEDSVLYLYADDSIPCKGGGSCNAALLIALNCKGNPRHRPVGSGWCAVYLDAGECGAEEAGIFACRFDQNGTVTKWAAARLDEQNDDVVITAMDVQR